MVLVISVGVVACRKAVAMSAYYQFNGVTVESRVIKEGVHRRASSRNVSVEIQIRQYRQDRFVALPRTIASIAGKSLTQPQNQIDAAIDIARNEVHHRLR